jgi:hypothetical protein
VTFRLADTEARVLEAFCRRQLGWDPGLAARVVGSPNAVGVFTAPPLDVLAFFAVPTAAPSSEALDVVVPLLALADELHRAPAEELAPECLPRAIVPARPGPSLSQLPPVDGWQLPIFAVSSDLVPLVEAATVEFDARSAGLSRRVQEQVANEIWQRPAFAGLPLRVLHAARQLGMLGSDMSRVSAATSGRWRRFSTPRGQVFAQASGATARLALHVVR